MASLDYEVSEEDLQQLSAMLDGEISNEMLDTMLARMAQEPALGAAWTRLSQVQAASHRHVQAGFDLDLSGRIAQKLRSSEQESTPTPVIPLHKDRTLADILAQSLDAKRDSQSNSSDLGRGEGLSLVGSSTEVQTDQILDLHPYNGIERRREAAKSKQPKSFRQQMLAHLAVAASVASITVWVQNSLIQTPQMADAAPVTENYMVEPATGVIPASLRVDQTLPLATVGNGESVAPQLGAESAVTDGEDNARVESLGGTLVLER